MWICRWSFWLVIDGYITCLHTNAILTSMHEDAYPYAGLPGRISYARRNHSGKICLAWSTWNRKQEGLMELSKNAFWGNPLLSALWVINLIILFWLQFFFCRMESMNAPLIFILFFTFLYSSLSQEIHTKGNYNHCCHSCCVVVIIIFSNRWKELVHYQYRDMPCAACRFHYGKCSPSSP